MKTRFFIIGVLPMLTALLLGCGSNGGGLTRAEKALISGSDSLMRVLTVADSADLDVLRAESVDFTAADLQSPEFAALVAKMKYTVQDPSQDGVGIAAPQVGLNRRLIVVCRLDLPGEPFEAFANVQIDSLWGEDLVGREGCLSIPGLRGNVARKEFAAISYADPSDFTVRSEVVSGYVARIFQHEVDHLAGILYTDRTGEIWEVEE
ncbi:MAG: peptide deformylase [Bacteroidales bacterium]|nr:peptide deformylase [Bacteroidales bacterium]